MPRFTFMHLTYEFPDNVNVIVREVECMGDKLADFDFYKDGQIIDAISWESQDIKRIDRVIYEDLI